MTRAPRCRPRFTQILGVAQDALDFEPYRGGPGKFEQDRSPQPRRGLAADRQQAKDPILVSAAKSAI